MGNIQYQYPESLEQPEHSTPYSYANDKRPFEEGDIWFWGGTTLDESKVLASSLRTVAHEINNARLKPHPTKSNRRDRPRIVRFDDLSSATKKVLGSLILLSQTNADWIFWRKLGRNSFSNRVLVQYRTYVVEYIPTANVFRNAQAKSKNTTNLSRHRIRETRREKVPDCRLKPRVCVLCGNCWRRRHYSGRLDRHGHRVWARQEQQRSVGTGRL